MVTKVCRMGKGVQREQCCLRLPKRKVRSISKKGQAVVPAVLYRRKINLD
ncbi:Protein of unknown function [Bacillus mycoides]|nr:Protein of unknown function [Bacillus mycoides]